MITKEKAMEFLKRQIDLIPALRSGRDDDLRKWQLDTQAMLERVFGDDSRQLATFKAVRWHPTTFRLSGDNSDLIQQAKRDGWNSANAVLSSLLNEIAEFWELDHQEQVSPDPFHRIERICNQFHRIARQLRDRHADRPTLNVEDEYDAQDLIHSLLLLDFDDVRAEDPSPSYAGAASRTDFVLKKERIVVEVKKARKGLLAKELGEQLIVDSQRYKVHPDCKMLVCFVYDPEGLIANPRGIENDLSQAGGEMPVRVYIRP